ncbi:MAG: Zn-ribbon domain-containing OB-fold protein [Sporichthyaceae bacterium]
MRLDGIDPRPRISLAPDGALRVLGVRCTRCPAVWAYPWPRCSRCGGEVVAASFGPFGTVWSATVVHIPIPGREPPYALAYVDLNEGPRVLAHLDEALPIGSRVRLRELTPEGDLRVEPA